MTHTADHTRNQVLLGLAVAGAIAAGLGLFLRTEKGEEVKEEVTHRAKQIAKRFNKTREELQETVREAFGEVSDELESKYLEIQGILMAEADEMKDDLTKDRYEEMVDKAVKKYAKASDWSERSIESLTRALKHDWKAVKEDLSRA